MSQAICSLLYRHPAPQSNLDPLRPRFHTTQQTIKLLQTCRKPDYSQLIQYSNKNLNSDPYTYTNGRWLRNNALQVESRHIAFDFDALCRRVLELSLGATSISSCDKKEGGFNRVFIFTTDNEKTAVARLPFGFTGPPSLTTNSEVATFPIEVPF